MNLPADFVGEIQKISNLVAPDEDELFASLYDIWAVVESYLKNTQFL